MIAWVPNRPVVTDHAAMPVDAAGGKRFSDDRKPIPGRPIIPIDNFLNDRSQIGSVASLAKLPLVGRWDIPCGEILCQCWPSGTARRAVEAKCAGVSNGFPIEIDRDLIGVRAIYREL